MGLAPKVFSLNEEERDALVQTVEKLLGDTGPARACMSEIPGMMTTHFLGFRSGCVFANVCVGFVVLCSVVMCSGCMCDSRILCTLCSCLCRGPNTIVLGAAVFAFSEVCPERYDLMHRHYRKLCQPEPPPPCHKHVTPVFPDRSASDTYVNANS